MKGNLELEAYSLETAMGCWQGKSALCLTGRMFLCCFFYKELKGLISESAKELCHQVEGTSDQTSKWCDTSLEGRTGIPVLWISAPDMSWLRPPLG